jgi:hypothetical protein
MHQLGRVVGTEWKSVKIQNRNGNEVEHVGRLKFGGKRKRPRKKQNTRLADIRFWWELNSQSSPSSAEPVMGVMTKKGNITRSTEASTLSPATITGPARAREWNHTKGQPHDSTK